MVLAKRLGVVAAAATLIAGGMLTGGTASAQVVDDIVNDIQHCDVDAFDPVWDSSANTVQGSASLSHCKFYLGFEVCLDYNGMIYAPSCERYEWPATSGDTKVVDCLPGLWATTLILEGNSNADGYLGRHSFPPVLFLCHPPGRP